MLGLVLRDNGFMDDSEDSFQELSNSSHQRFNILCSADKDGNISLGIFGIFPIRKVNMHNLTFPTSRDGSEMSNRISKASIHKWSDAMNTFQEKLSSLSTLVINHGLDSLPQEEFLSLLGGARTSPPVHQFLVNTLGEVGVKHISKVLSGAGKNLNVLSWTTSRCSNIY
ncbi:hypothetical protein JHK84_031876 [Glycine max]|nr:hypothetical protein JHK86_031735 [Glycine max]KAG5146333.1 hypothetical protein JHK84_031876 [Glycine max]